MTLLVRDEEDIIESNLRFHRAQGVDFFIVMDHQSQDRTPEIVKSFCRQGLAELVAQPDPGYRQAEWVTWMARRAATEHGATWVINNDADEFWWPMEGTLRSTLASVADRYGAVYVPRLNFHPVEAPPFTSARARTKAFLQRISSGISPEKKAPKVILDTAAKPSGPKVFFETMTLCDLNSLNSLGQPLPGKMCHRAHPDVEVTMGNHSVNVPDGLDVCAAPLMEILHFPVRSAAQFCHKIAVGGAALQHSPDVPGGETWRTLHTGERGQNAVRYYRSTRVTRRGIKQMLASGRLREDTRLRDFMRAAGAEKAPVE